VKAKEKLIFSFILILCCFKIDEYFYKMVAFLSHSVFF
jgi:hypothetical protein